MSSIEAHLKWYKIGLLLLSLQLLEIHVFCLFLKDLQRGNFGVHGHLSYVGMHGYLPYAGMHGQFDVAQMYAYLPTVDMSVIDVMYKAHWCAGCYAMQLV
jgi:hypothetical protein